MCVACKPLPSLKSLTKLAEITAHTWFSPKPFLHCCPSFWVNCNMWWAGHPSPPGQIWPPEVNPGALFSGELAGTRDEDPEAEPLRSAEPSPRLSQARPREALDPCRM